MHYVKLKLRLKLAYINVAAFTRFQRMVQKIWSHLWCYWNGNSRNFICNIGNIFLTLLAEVTPVDHYARDLFINYNCSFYCCCFWTRKAGPKKPLQLFFLLLESVLLGPKIPEAFLIHSGAQRNFAYTFVLALPTDLPSQIFHSFLPARRYASAGLCDSDVSVCLSVCLSVCHTPVLCLAERKQDREMYTIW